MQVHEAFFRPQWQQLTVLIGSFAGAIGLGMVLARFLLKPSDLASGFSCFTFLLILFLGYQLWVTFIAAAVSRGFLKGFWNSMLRFVFRRDEQSVRQAAEDLVKELRDEQKIRDLMISIRAKTSIFRRMGAMIGVLGGLFLAVLWSAHGFLLSFAAYSLSGYLYGSALTALGREGYLPIPEDIDF